MQTNTIHMNASRPAYWVLSVLLLASAISLPAQVLFSDTFNRSNSNNLGTNNNALGGSILANWVENDGGGGAVPANHSISGNSLRLFGTGFDSYLNHNFTYAELGTSFAVEFDLTIASGNNNAWAAVLLGKGTSFVTGIINPDVVNATTPLGVLFRSDSQVVIWDGGNNGGGAAPATLTNATRAIRIEIDSPTGLSGTTDNQMRLFIDNAQFGNLRNQGTNEYYFGWNAGSDFYIAFESNNNGNSTEKYIDNLKITSLVPEPGTGALVLLGGLGLLATRFKLRR